MPKAASLLRIYSIRLSMNDEGITKWPSPLRIAVESLVAKLKNLGSEEEVVVHADENRDPIGRFIRAATGEVLGEIPRPALVEGHRK